ncbi:acyl-CoA N-acyltransferase [Lyophyllum atratum]|nr:acyl-CoA N-acyltransferase [Lyophyllum atratum]
MANPSFIIDTSRLQLTQFVPSSQAHCAFLVELYNSPEFIAAEGKTAIISEEAARERIQTRFVAESNAQPIGTVSLTKGDAPGSFPIPDIGFAIVPEQTKQGYATEAASALLAWAAKERGVTEGSRRMLEKLGFEDRGLKKLKPFGGVEGAVYAKPEMKDLKEYGFE